MSYQLPLCFRQLLFKVMFSCLVSVCVLYCYRTASPLGTEQLSVVTFFRPVNVLKRGRSSLDEKLFYGFLLGRKVGKL
jgi:hypothetical protein